MAPSGAMELAAIHFAVAVRLFWYGPGVGLGEPTVITSESLYTAPVLSHAWTTTECPPAFMLTAVFRFCAFTTYTLELST